MRKLSQGDDKNLSQSCPDHVEQSWDLNLDALSFRLCSSSYALGLPCAYCIEQTRALGPFLPKQDGVVKSTHENKKKKWLQSLLNSQTQAPKMFGTIAATVTVFFL